ncbi:MAG TPA: hypothetical protein EYQ74_10775 [Planctomycetes bacterium]|nr:hypothetical protein [Planctomycetota bacterium]HIK59160.1 hypothetical protein [Planctomycetota bacterium]
MNRTLAILLAMAMLLAHSLTLHLNPEGHLGEPYEYAHRAYRLARNLIREGALVWNAGLEGSARGGLESYPSPLWVGLSTLAERFYLPVTRITQIVGMAAALMTVRFSVMFDKDRISSIIPALLLVTSGAFAAAAPSGLETPLVAFLLTAAFVSFERARRSTFSIALLLLVVARPEGALAIVLFALFAILDRLRAQRDPSQEMPPGAFLPALLATAFLLWTPNSSGQSLYGTWIASLLSFDAARASQGLGYLNDLFATAITPVLVVFPIGGWITGRLTRTGRRALVWAVAWMTIVTLQGGGLQPFSVALVPALPLLAIAIQQGILAALDTGLKFMEKVSWAALMLTCLLGILATKSPVSLQRIQGTVPILTWLSAGKGPTPLGGEPVLGIVSVTSELKRTVKLRDVGLFLRASVPTDYTLLSPYSGAIAYLSRMQVLDLNGQITTPEGTELTPPWNPRPSIDLLAALGQDADFVLVGLKDIRETELGGAFGLGLGELLMLDGSSENPERRALIGAQLDEYELVTVPVYAERRHRSAPFPLLRRKDLGLTPRLEIQHVDNEIRVLLTSDWPKDSTGWPGNPHLVRLALEGTDENGKVWFLNPQGISQAPTRNARNQKRGPEVELFARPDLLLQPTPERWVRLAAIPLLKTPNGTRLVELRAQLFNPYIAKQSRFAPASSQVSLKLE